MDTIKLETLREIAVKLAAKKGLDHSMIEDFAQEVCQKHLEGRKATVGQLLIDYVRIHQGRYATSLARMARPGSLPLDEDSLSITDDPSDEIDFLYYLNLLDGNNRVTIYLKYQWGLTEREIGIALGVSESRVCQNLKTIRTLLLKRIASPSGRLRTINN